MLFTERKPFLLNIALILALLAGFLGAVPTKAAQKEFSSSRNFFDSNRALSLDEGESELLTLQQPDANIETGANSVFSLQNFSAPFFEPYVNIPVGDAYAVGMGDFNNDGFRDVAITTDTQLMILLQNSDGSLANSVTYAAGSSPYSLAVGDLNNDGRDDVVVANYFGNTLSVFLQQSDGTFASRLIYSTSSGPDSVVVGDVNSDGLADITVAHWTAANIGVFTQTANGTLNAMVTYTSPQAGRDDISIADVNNDGRNDVIKMNGQGFNPSLSVYLQNANSSLAAPQSYSVTNCGFFCLSHGLGTGDVTGDGLTDIVLSYGGNTPNSKIAVFAQGQDGSLGSPVAYEAYDLPEPVEVSDVNNDGLADVLVAHSGWNALSVFTQQNGGVLDPYSLYTIPFGHYKPQGLAVGDINHDGLSDVAIADDNNGLVLLYQTLTPPNTPTPTSTPSATPTPSLTFTPSSTPTRMPTPIWLFISGNTGVGSTTLSFSTGVSITSDENGDYSYAVPFGWTGQIYPSKPGYRFTPVYQSYNSVQSDLSNQNFIAERVYTISGNAGHPGATLNYMEGGISKTAFTLGNGNYSFQVPEHWSGTVVPSMPDYIFTPASKSYSDVQADQTSQDYTAIQSIMTISGDVRHSGVTLSYVENGVLKTATSNSNGSYFFKVNSGWSGTVTPSKAGVIFDPVSKSYSNVQSNQTAQNYKASIPVTNLADSGSGSLRQAISSAVYGDVITFHPDLAGQTITLASIINIGTGLTINGLGLNPRVEISGNSAVGIFGVDPRFDPSGGPRDVKFQSLILKNANTAIGIGGGNVFIEDVSFIGNTAYDGGAISSCCFNTTITITRSDFTSNSAQHYGGAIRTQFGSLTVRSSTFTNNSAGSVGGAISIERQGPYTFEDNTFSNNNALSGGAIAFESIEEPIIIRRNLFSNNSVSLNGGAIFELFAESFLIENNTFFGNQANDSGGGISISSTATIRNNTFSNNRALQNGASLSLGAAYLYNNILANNTGGGECNIRSAGWVVGSNNLIEGGSTNCAATITGNPMLGPLADNGGSTKTMALLHGSPAIDTGNGVHCPATDQRGVARPLGNGCDIGAFEYVPLYLSLTGNQTNGGVASADEDILRFDGKNWSLFFDGSDVGVGNSDLFGFSIVDADTILMAFNTSFTLNGMSVTPRDVLQFDATSLGSNTAGTFSMYINGIDVGLDVAAENIDSIGLLPDGRVLLSTTGNPVVTGITGGRDEDVLAFTPTSLGNNTSGSWSLYFDGSDTGLGETSGEDVDGLDITSNGNIYLSTAGDFTAGGIIGADEDVFVCVPTSLGNVTSCNYLPVLYFDGSIWGLTTNDVDALNLFAANTIQTIPPTSTPTPTFTPITTSTRTPTITPTFTRTPTPTATSTSGSQVLPDLMISSMRIELQNTSCLMPGDPMGVRVWVTNSGQAAAGSFVVNVNGVTQTVNGLAINETKAVFFSGAGNPVSAIVDSTNIVLESNEDNNARSETLPVPTPPLPCPTLTPSPTFTPTIIPSFTNTPGGSDLIFADGFESGGFSAWSSNTNDAGDLNVSAAAALVGTRGMQTLIDDANTIYVTDDTPNAETRYRVHFYFDPNSITMASGDAHFIFKAFMGTGTDVLQVEFRNWAGAYQIRGKVLNDASAFVVTNWVAISDAPHFIEVDWVASTGAGANNGGLTLRLDGFQQAALTGVDNDTSRIDRVRLGALAGMDAGTNGIYYFDAFESRRQNYIGP